MTDDKEIALQEHQRILREELGPLDKELAAMSLPPVSKLKNSRVKYKVAIPLLLEWLFKVNYHTSKDIIIGALAVTWAKPMAAKPLIEAYHQADSGQPFEHLRWSIGNALAFVADDSIADDLIAIAEDRRYGRERVMAVNALKNLKDPRAIDVLIYLLRDDNVDAAAIDALGKLAPANARPYVEPFLTHKDSYVRRETKKAIANIDRKNNPGSISTSKTPQINAISLKEPIPAGYVETSASIDYEDLEELLKPLQELVRIGFGKFEILQIVAGADEIETDGFVSYDFPVKFAGDLTSIRMMLQVDNDNDEIDVYAYSIPALIKAYEVKMRAVLERQDE